MTSFIDLNQEPGGYAQACLGCESEDATYRLTLGSIHWFYCEHCLAAALAQIGDES